MTNNPTNADKEQQKTDEAWARLQGTLANEPVNHKWAAWGRNAERTESAGFGGISAADFHEADGVKITERQGTSVGSTTEESAPARRRRMSQRSKWAVAAASVAVFAAMLSTPVGNTAMAAILNQFRMETVTVVNENDLRNMFYQVSENGSLDEVMNEFGTFTNASGTFGGELTPAQIQEKLGYAPLNGVLPDPSKEMTVSPSQEITLNLNVDKVNKAMQRLGAVHLVPESVNGKPITLHIPEHVYYDLSTGKDQWASLSQMNTPVVTVDPSIKIEEALAAVVNFPLLPDHLKSSLQQSRVLSGEIPMPLIARDNTEQIEVAGTTVILDRYDYNDSTNYNAVWVQNGQLFELSGGNLYPSKEKMVAKLQGLIKQ